MLSFFLNLQVCVFHQILDFFSHYSFSCSLSSSSGTVTIQMLDLWLLSQGPEMPFFFSLYSLSSSDWVNSLYLSSSALILSCLLLSPTEAIQQVFISVTAFFSSMTSTWFFYITSISLLRFSIFFPICFKSVCNSLLKQCHDDCSKIFFSDNSNLTIILMLESITILFHLVWVLTGSWYDE